MRSDPNNGVSIVRSVILCIAVSSRNKQSGRFCCFLPEEYSDHDSDKDQYTLYNYRSQALYISYKGQHHILERIISAISF